MKNSPKAYRVAAVSVALAICGTQAGIAVRTPVPRVQGITDVVAFMKRVAPDEPVLYDGSYDGVFTFYLLSGDPGYQRQVVRGAKIFYASAIMPMWSYRSYVDSAQDVVHVLETRGGCRWLVIEIGKQSNDIPAARLLREAVHGPQFELVRSFPVSGPGLERIDVYRFQGNIQPVKDADLPFPILGDQIRLKARPIQR